MTKTEATRITGGLSRPSKMPCPSFNLPAVRCKVGSRLRGVPGSVCASCYALKGRYVFPNVQAALERRYQRLRDPRWVEAMTRLIEEREYFRWHDSGDLRDVAHLEAIAAVARATPGTRHWLPTRERATVRAWLRANNCPMNLCIRVSDAMVDGGPTRGLPVLDWNRATPTSGVHTRYAEIPRDVHVCPAPKQGGKCGDCRACWNRQVKRVSYAKH